MALNTSTRTTPAAGSTRRLAGPDVVRAVALIGVVVMNYHGYLIIRGADRGEGWADDLFDPWSGPLSTRFAAAFVLVAGVGVTLLTRRSLGDVDRVTEMRWRLVRRGAILYVAGLFLDTIWAGTIITYYGALFVLSAGLFTLRSRWIVGVGALAVVSATLLQVWAFRRAEAGGSTSWLFFPDAGSVQGYVFDVAVNGTHPLLPWLGFFCAGILLGRLPAMTSLRNGLRTTGWRATMGGVGLMLAAGAEVVHSIADTDFSRLLLSTEPASRSVVYVASALGTSLVAYVLIDAVTERFPNAVDPLRRAGQLSLSLYLLHIVVFNFVVDWMEWVVPTDLTTSLLFAGAFWVAAIALANVWHRRFGRGPAERVYRAIGG